MEKIIKNMVCPRCVESVQSITKEMGLPVSGVEIGSVEFHRKLSDDELTQFSDELQKRGFELVSDRDTELVNRVKTVLIAYLKYLETNESPQKVSVFVSNHIHYNYSYLSHIFAENEKDTIESYLIKLKIERVKELLSFNRYTLSEIAYRLKYSSVQYLSNQFKKITGKTVTEYKKQGRGSRISIDKL